MITYDEAAGSGLISGDDNIRYRFVRSELQQLDAPRSGTRVDFAIRGDEALGVFILQSVRQPYSGPRRPDTTKLSPWGCFVYGMKHYADGYGRARRREFWYFTLFQWLFILAPVLIAFMIAVVTQPEEDDGPTVAIGLFFILAALAYLGFFIPAVCARVRRFHDVGLSGWLTLINGVPYIGPLAVFVITVLPTEKRANVHGPIPGQGATDPGIADIFS